MLRQERLLKRPGLLLAKIPWVVILYSEWGNRELIHDFWVLSCKTNISILPSSPSSVYALVSCKRRAPEIFACLIYASM